MAVDDGALASPSETPEVEPYDFGRSTTLSREHTRMLEVAFETFSRQWGSRLSARVHSRAHASLEQLSLLTYDDYARTLPATTTMVVYALPESDERIVVQLPLSLAIEWIMQMLGGRVDASPDERPLTPIEQALVRGLMGDGGDALTTALDGLLPAGISIASIQHSPLFAQVAGPNDLVIVARLSLRSSGSTSDVTVMLPASVVLDAFAVGRAEAADAAVPGLVRSHIERTPIELALRLTPRPVLPREILDLAVGDVLTFPHPADRPLELTVDGVPIATAAVGASGARLACVITATTPDPESPEE
ncbi:flagellar motor switch protein FliM [Microbacterium sp.]|uniref:flagellar motor switch protein FliM n=1 Tax=Microbacterium sp. TaxID=51671 RepID=UPI003C78939D